MIWIPIIAATLYGLAIGHLKWVLQTSKANPKTLVTLELTFLFIATLPFISRHAVIGEGAFDFRYLILFAFLVMVGVVQNYFLIRGLKKESLHEFELIDLLLPLFTVSLAAIVFVDERKPLQLILAFVAALAFLMTHMNKMHLHFKRADRWLLFAIFVMAIERLLVKPLLTMANPLALYSLRTGFAALCTFLIFRPDFEDIKRRDVLWLIVNAMIGFASMFLMWTSIGNYGVVVTELFMLISPFILALLSVWYFRESWNHKQTLAFGVIIGCIILMNVLGK